MGTAVQLKMGVEQMARASDLHGEQIGCAKSTGKVGVYVCVGVGGAGGYG